MIKCRPFYLPREIPAAFIVAVYAHPRANAKLAIDSPYDGISKQLNTHPDCVFIAAVGDFNHSNLKTVLPKFYKNVHISTRNNRY